MAFNLADIFEHAVDHMPDRLALVGGDRRLSFSELEDRSNRLAHHMASLGVAARDHVGVYAPNCTEWVETMLACFKVRAVPVNVNFRYVEDELRYLFDNADIVAVVHDPEFAVRLDAIAGDLPRLRHRIAIGDEYESILEGSSAERQFPERSPDDLYVLYTGGTTGMPKGVMWRQEDVFFALGQGIDAVTGHRVEAPDELAKKGAAAGGGLVFLVTPPLMHGAAQWGTFGQMMQGNTVVLMPRFDAHEVWRLVEAERVNSVLIAGDAIGRPMIEALDEIGERYDLSSLIAVASSAALFSQPVKERFFDRFPNLIITDSIGSSEGGFNGLSQGTKGQAPSGAGGPRVAPMADVIVVDDDMQPLAPGDGRVGKVARAGDIPLGYYKDPGKTAQVFLTGPDGRRHVVAGDFARWEDDGSITLLGRGSVCINSGGEKVFPEEVEGTLKSHPDVFDAIVVGVPDERWGSAVAAVVQPRTGAAPTLDDLATHARARIAAYKVPRHLVLVDEVVRSPAGKPDYPWATTLAAERITGP